MSLIYILVLSLKSNYMYQLDYFETRLMLNILHPIIDMHTCSHLCLLAAYGTLLEEDVLVLPLDLLKFDQHQPAVDEVLARFRQVTLVPYQPGYFRALYIYK